MLHRWMRGETACYEFSLTGSSSEIPASILSRILQQCLLSNRAVGVFVFENLSIDLLVKRQTWN